MKQEKNQTNQKERQIKTGKIFAFRLLFVCKRLGSSEVASARPGAETPRAPGVWGALTGALGGAEPWLCSWKEIEIEIYGNRPYLSWSL